jgi:hypothetical protein
MLWPSPQDYNEAVQNPQLCFSDPELQEGEPELTALMLPKAISGGFASVYRMQCQEKDWAVRCFLRHFADQQERYLQVTNQLEELKLPYTVGFKFLHEGIKVRDKWYPILKMEWIDGQQLNEYVRDNLPHPSSLLHVATQLRTMLVALRQASIAHGDLQHGNILIENSNLKLIDYDCMFVPSMTGSLSYEIGNRNYQSPRRTEKYFGPGLDNFSGWLIYLSLIALSVEPNLWSQVRAGDEYLLFRRQDFEQPQSSTTLQALARHSSDRLRALANLFQSLLYLDLDQIPSVSEALQYNLTGSITTNENRAPRVINNSFGSQGIHWLLDFSDTNDKIVPQSFGSPVWIPRLVLTLSSLILLLSLFYQSQLQITFTIEAMLSVCVLAILLVFLCYRRDSHVVEAGSIRTELSRLKTELNLVPKTIIDIEKKKSNAKQIHERDVALLTKQRSQLETSEERELQAVINKLNNTLEDINVRREKLGREESEATSKVRSLFASKRQELEIKIPLLERQEKEELQSALKTIQYQHLESYLRKEGLSNLEIGGIDNATKQKLIMQGFRYAWDLEYDTLKKMTKLNSTEISALLNWRGRIESEAVRTMPKSLPPQQSNQIRSQYRNHKGKVELDLKALPPAAVEERKIKESNAKARDGLTVERTNAQGQANVQIEAIKLGTIQEYATNTQKIAASNASLESELSALDLEIAQTKKRLFPIYLGLVQNEHRLSPYCKLSLNHYLAALFLPKASVQAKPNEMGAI